MKQNLQDRLTKISGDIIVLFCSGKASCYSNMDMMQYNPGTIHKIQDLCAQRNLLIDMINEDARDQAQEEKEIDANTAGVVGESDSR